MSRVASAKADVAIKRRRSRAFQVLFDPAGALGDEAEIVLAALRDFCFARTSTTGLTDQQTYLNNGRREVWLFLTKELNFDERTIANFVEAADEYFGNID